MPQAKRSAAKAPAAKRAPARSSAGKSGSMSASTRLQLERATKRLENSLEQASQALKALGRDVGHSGHRSYKDIGTGLNALRRNAKDANRTLTADLKKLRATATSSKPAGRRAASGKSTAPRSTKSPSKRSKSS
jgi:uncharacterized protein YukE